MEEPWTLKQNPYTAGPEGDALDMARRVMRFLNEE